MNNTQVTLPSGKFDIEAVQKLNEHTPEDLFPYIDALVSFLQDSNWPIFEPVTTLLGTKFSIELFEPIKKVLIGDDSFWKWSCLQAMKAFPINSLEPFFPILEELAQKPLLVDMQEGIQTVSTDIIVERFPEKCTFHKGESIYIGLKFLDIRNSEEFFNKFLSFSDPYIIKYKNTSKIILPHASDPQINSNVYVVWSDESILANVHTLISTWKSDDENSYFQTTPSYTHEEQDFVLDLRSKDAKTLNEKSSNFYLMILNYVSDLHESLIG